MRRPGCITPLGIAAGIITLVIIAGVALASGGSMFNPGPLSAQNEAGRTINGVKSHADIGGNCGACHVDPWSSEVMGTRCMNCHTDIRAQINDPKSLHDAMPNVMQCRQCHSEHNGAQASLTRVNFDNFPHERLGFALAAHQKMASGQPFKCADCHGDAVTTFDRTKCEACHRDYQSDFVTKHVTDFGHDCMACHDGVDRFSNFNHNRLKFTLIGAHAEIQCGQCHANVHAVADFQNASSACADCHRKDDAHNGAFGADCAQCHSAESWEKATFDHNLAAFKLTGKHTTVGCEKCHVNNVFKGTPQTCVGCHQNDDAKAHQGAFGTDCGQCHNPSSWQDARFDHNLAAFKLTGAHVNAQCQTCHINNVFKGTPTLCGACHAKDDEHNGAFGSNCAQCHTTSSWEGATFDHNLAAFKLTGAHVNVRCQTCHVNDVFKGTPTSCGACHAKDDEHGGAFGANCGQCHTTSSWEGADSGEGEHEGRD